MGLSSQNESLESLLGRLLTSLRSFRRLYLLIGVLVVTVTFYITFFAPSNLSHLAPSSWKSSSGGGSSSPAQTQPVYGESTPYGAPVPTATDSYYAPPASTPLSSKPSKPFSEIPKVNLPDDWKVIALVFFGRREMVRTLDCFLKRNLKKNGGLLDEVIFAMNTDEGSRLKPEDLKYLEEELLPNEPSYRKWTADKEYKWWLGNWAAANDPKAIYVKIDDDVVYFDDLAIPSIVKRLYENEDLFAVSTNVVNNPALSWVHRHLGVYYPYWPEMNPPIDSPAPSWRASELPKYSGPADGPKDFKMDGGTPAPFYGHRWLPVPFKDGETMYDTKKFPETFLTYDAFGPSLGNWAAAAQLHYSFLQHLEEETTWRYKFDMWDYFFDRLSINFIALRGTDIIEAFPFPMKDDEHFITQVRPAEVKKRVVVDGSGLAVHFNFGPQYDPHGWHAIRDTDLLTRYHLYAKENYCNTKYPSS